MNKKILVLGIGIALALNGCTVNISDNSPDLPSEAKQDLPSEAKQDFLACEAFVNDWGKGAGRIVTTKANYGEYLDDVNLIIATIDSFETSLALRVVRFLEESMQSEKATYDVDEDFPRGLVDITLLFEECITILGIE